MPVSIPHSEFCSFGPDNLGNGVAVMNDGFNSPFGILFVRTT